MKNFRVTLYTMIIQFILMNLVLLVPNLSADSVREKDVQTCHFELRKLNVSPGLASRTCIQKRPLNVLEITRRMRAKGLSPDASAEEALRISNQSVFE